MSLGLARDSILGLSDLVHDDDPNDFSPAVQGVDGGDDFGIGMDLDDGGDDGVSDVRTVDARKSGGADAAAVGAVASVSVSSPPPPPTPSDPAPSLNPAEEEEKAEQRGGATAAYTGFYSGYHEYGDYYSADPYAVDYGGGGQKRKSGGGGAFCCIFAPWLKRGGDDSDFDSDYDDHDDDDRDDDVDDAEGMVTPRKAAAGVGAGAKDDPLAPMDSITLAKRKAAKAAEAEAAKVAEAEVAEAEAEEAGGALEYEEEEWGEEKRGEPARESPPAATEEEKDDDAPEPPPKRGILKQTSVQVAKRADTGESSKGGSADGGGRDGRRRMFPTLADKTPPTSSASSTRGGESSASKKCVNFAPMARVVTVPSRKELTFIQKAQIWWQRTDYDDFKKTGRIIAKAMLQGGSEIWLTSNDAWGRRQHGGGRGGGSEPEDEEEENVEPSEYERALLHYTGRSRSVGDHPSSSAREGGIDSASFGNKWWCKFGHSRRGLEHIASAEEGKQRQRNVGTALKAIIEEQRRQRFNNVRDPDKLAKVALQYTTWARDLALAAGAADAEAVRSGFDAGAKCRAHYLRAGVSSPSPSPSAPGAGVDGHQRFSFADPHHTIAPQLLDANTHPEERRRVERERQKQREQQQQQQQQNKKTAKQDSMAESLAAARAAEQRRGGGGGGSEEADEGGGGGGAPGEMREAIHDPDSSHECLAKKATGFHASGERMDMKAVLTGMGPVSVQG